MLARFSIKPRIQVLEISTTILSKLRKEEEEDEEEKRGKWEVGLEF